MDQYCGPRETAFVLASSNAPELWCTGSWNGSGWEWSLSDKPDTRDENIPLELPKDAGPHRVTIYLQVPDDGPRFHTSDPLWFNEGACPERSQKESDQIIRIRRQPTKLTFINLNEGEGRYIYYALNFTVGKPFDPMFKNGGGR